MANPPKPQELKRRQGTYRDDRDPSGGNAPAIAPANSSEVALPPGKVLDAVLDRGVVWLAETDTPKMALLREALEDYEVLRRVMDPTDRFSVGLVREARQEVSKLLSELGFDPTARSRLGLAEVKKQSKLAQLRQAEQAEQAKRVVDARDV